MKRPGDDTNGGRGFYVGRPRAGDASAFDSCAWAATYGEAVRLRDSLAVWSHGLRVEPVAPRRA